MKHIVKITGAASLLSVAIAAGLTTLAVNAADKMTDHSKSQPYSHSDRSNIEAYRSDRDALKAQLRPGKDAAFYLNKLVELGYQVTAINDSEPDYVEYEVVKGNNSHEVQIDLDEVSKKATEVDVTMNLWRATSTKAALRGEKIKTMTTHDYSDRTYVKGWADEKDRLEKELGIGQNKAYYAKKLRALGYQVTATNDQEADYLEYEVVKGTRTYEVQVDFDKTYELSTKVDVTANMWHANATDKALSAAKH